MLDLVQLRSQFQSIQSIRAFQWNLFGKKSVLCQTKIGNTVTEAIILICYSGQVRCNQHWLSKTHLPCKTELITDAGGLARHYCLQHMTTRGGKNLAALIATTDASPKWIPEPCAILRSTLPVLPVSVWIARFVALKVDSLLHFQQQQIDFGSWLLRAAVHGKAE